MSFRADNGPDTVRCDGPRTKLPKIGWVRMREVLRFSGSIREVTVSKEAGRWYATFVVEDGTEPPEIKDGAILGVDVGMKTLVMGSDGTPDRNSRALKGHRA